MRGWGVRCRLRKQRGSEVDCDAAGAAASAATMFRRHGSSTTLAGQPLPARGSGSSSSSTWSWAAFRLLGRLRLRQMQQQDGRVAGGQQQQAAGQGQQHRREGGEGARWQAADLQQQQHYMPLSDTCYLLARKFAPDAVPVSSGDAGPCWLPGVPAALPMCQQPLRQLQLAHIFV